MLLQQILIFLATIKYKIFYHKIVVSTIELIVDAMILCVCELWLDIV